MNTARIARLAVLITALIALLAPTMANASTKATTKARTASNQCTNADIAPDQATPAQVRTATLCLINAERTARSLRPLRAQATLTTVAAGFATQMGTQQFFDHTSPQGSTLLTRVKSTTYVKRARTWSLGENIGWATGTNATPRAMVNAWMHSPPHRANLLTTTFTEIGIGTANGGGTSTDQNPDNIGTTYVTDFGTRN